MLIVNLPKPSSVQTIPAGKAYGVKELLRNHQQRMKKDLIVVCSAIAIVVAGCSGEEKKSTPSTPSAPKSAANPVAPTASPAAPAAPNAPEAPASVFANTSGEGATSDGVPTKDADGKTIDTLAGLNRAVEYYTRVLQPMQAESEEQAKTFKGYPPLTSLEQLVQYKVIRAVPPAPAGKKWSYDTQKYQVVLIDAK